MSKLARQNGSPMYRVDFLVQGFPGYSPSHGALGWPTVALLRSQQHNVLIDTGGYGYRSLLISQLAGLGVVPDAVTAVAVTHCHWDHISNYPMFHNADIYVPGRDLDWACHLPAGDPFVPELHVRDLRDHARVIRVHDNEEILPGLSIMETPGHTPGHVSYIARTTNGQLVFAGDALKNEFELRTKQVDITVDPGASRQSIERLAELSEREEATLVCGHDRMLVVQAGAIVPRSDLRATLVAHLPPDVTRQHALDLAPVPDSWSPGSHAGLG